MKVKLLKKIRKRFLWNYSKKKKVWTVVDNVTRKHYVINKKYAKKYMQEDDSYKPECGWGELKFRLFKVLVIKPFKHNVINEMMYRNGKNAINSALKKKNGKI